MASKDSPSFVLPSLCTADLLPGNVAAVGTESGRVAVLSADGALLAEATLGSSAEITSVASASARAQQLVLATSAHGEVALLSAGSFGLRREFSLWHSAAATCASRCGETPLFASCSEDGSLHVFRADGPVATVVQRKSSSAALEALTFVAEDQILAVGASPGGLLSAFDLRDRRAGPSVCLADPSPGTTLHCVSAHPLDPCVAVGASDGVVSVWDRRMGSRQLHWRECHDGFVWAVRYHPDDPRLLLSGGEDGVLAMHAATDGGDAMAGDRTGVGVLRKGTVPVNSVGVLRDDGEPTATALVACEDGAVEIFPCQI